MPMLESASPALWIKTLRRFRSRRPRTSARVIPPLTASAASDIQNITPVFTGTGASSRPKAA
jgi:hypothetical protein